MFNPNSLILYKFATRLDADKVSDAVKEFPFIPCGATDFSKMGFISPDNTEHLIYSDNNQSVITIQIEKKLLPNAVVKKAVADKVEAQEKLFNRKLGKSEKLSLKDEVLIDLLPQAFSQFARVNIWFNWNEGFLAVDTSSVKKAEECLAVLRKSIGSLGLTLLLNSDKVPQQVMTGWLNGCEHNGFDIGDKASLSDPLVTLSKVKVTEFDLESDQIKQHINAGLMVDSIELKNNEVSFTLNKSLTLSKIKIADIIYDEMGHDDIYGNFNIVTGLLTITIGSLNRLFNPTPA